MPYIKSICKAGKTIEVAAYYTRRYKPKDGRRGKKERETTEKQQQINDRQLEKKLTRIINANFDGDSWYITLTYKTENRPKDAEELKRHIREFLKKLRKVYKQEGRELKYIETAEVGERGAMHIHILVNDIDTRKIARLWSGWKKLGYEVVRGSRALFGCSLIWGSKGDEAVYKANFFGKSQVEKLA